MNKKRHYLRLGLLISNVALLVVAQAYRMRSDNSHADWFVGIIAAILVILLVFLLVERRLGAYKRAITGLSTSKAAWLCMEEFGNSYRILTADASGYSLLRIIRGNTKIIRSWPRTGTTISKSSVQLTVARSFDGISLVNAGEPPVSLVIYSPDSGMFARPLRDVALNEAIATLTT